MKKFTALGLSLILAVSALAGCGTKNTPASGSDKVTAKVIDIELTQEEYAFGVDKDQPELLAQTNAFIAEIKADGTFDKICNNYFGDGTPTPVTSAEFDPAKDQLVVAVNAAFEPFEYMQGENYYGIDMEIAAALAKKLNKELVISNMEFGSVCLSIGQHKCDIAMSGLTIKEERREYVDFTDSYYIASQKLITLSTDTTFDACTDAASVEAILNTFDSSVKIGVQNGTTGELYCEGDAELEFDGYAVTTTGYKNGSLAVQDLLNGNIQYVVIDSAPATCITEALNKMQ